MKATKTVALFFVVASRKSGQKRRLTSNAVFCFDLWPDGLRGLIYM